MEGVDIGDSFIVNQGENVTREVNDNDVFIFTNETWGPEIDTETGLEVDTINERYHYQTTCTFSLARLIFTGCQPRGGGSPRLAGGRLDRDLRQGVRRHGVPELPPRGRGRPARVSGL